MPKGKPKRVRASSDTSGGVLASLPAYARIVAWVGFPAAAAAYLIYVLASVQGARFEKIETLLQQEEKHSIIVEQHLATDAEQGWILVGLLQRTCMNVARNDDDKMACIASQRNGK